MGLASETWAEATVCRRFWALGSTVAVPAHPSGSFHPWEEHAQFLRFLQPGLRNDMHEADLNLTHSLKQNYPSHLSKLWARLILFASHICNCL